MHRMMHMSSSYLAWAFTCSSFSRDPIASSISSTTCLAHLTQLFLYRRPRLLSCKSYKNASFPTHYMSEYCAALPQFGLASENGRRPRATGSEVQEWTFLSPVKDGNLLTAQNILDITKTGTKPQVTHEMSWNLESIHPCN